MCIILPVFGSTPLFLHCEINIQQFKTDFQRYRLVITRNVGMWTFPKLLFTITLLWSLIVSIYCVGGLLGCLCSGYLVVKYGKKKCLLCNNMLIMVAALHMGFSKTAKSFEMILIGRFLYGISAGVCLNAHSQYLGEISPKKLRGFANTNALVFLTLGKVLGQIMGLRYLSILHTYMASSPHRARGWSAEQLRSSGAAAFCHELEQSWSTAPKPCNL
uniref:Major facilitator superfamily (MFS) profile domain-containing protein n=1 Tax=Gopherus evgoodei TaxID=1825980 RepID=A0A8C4WUK6_9SAUR